MIIEIRGAEFINKGAELMLHAIMQQVQKKYPDAEFVMEHGSRTPITKHRLHGIKTKFKKIGKGEYVIKSLSHVLPASVLNRFDVIKEQQVDVVFDASGFAFGDKWGVEKAGKRLANHVKSWKENGKKIIVLPQAFGPFTDPDLRIEMKKILTYSDLVYARDRISYEHLTDIDPENNRIRLRPDITSLVEGELPDYFDEQLHQVAVIPNIKMIEATKEEVGDHYLAFLRKCIEEIKRQGFSPFFLLHEMNKDEDLAVSVNGTLEEPIPVLTEDNALWVKGMIGASRAVITSRFHGLASSLFQAVPCVTTGWSHKYEQLLHEYDYPEGMCRVTDWQETQRKIRMILDPTMNEEIHQKLLRKVDEQKRETSEMWDEIFTVISRT